MSTTSRAPAVTDAIIGWADPPAPIFEAWPGPEAAKEMIVLGQVDWTVYAIPTIKAGRKQRQEEFEIEFEVYVVGGAGTSPASPKVARDRAFELFTFIEDNLADDVSAGLGFESIQHIQVHPKESGPRTFERGWMYRIAGAIAVASRLV